ncbi:hypothetical protein COW64_21610 [bacterium (Candidatus Blackallbacteria) CG18_big_fil_WC_8_21_14_2_50_49_26]|nr:MAG: hypothetical protein COW64_21610 [bacterium (Candidatus Blackallbacteria) CG18_big_fil_WC_8_21_14_2_50_49_26]
MFKQKNDIESNKIIFFCVIFYFVLNINMLTLAQNYPSPPDYLKPYVTRLNKIKSSVCCGSFDYTSHARQGDVVVMSGFDEGALLIYVINVKNGKVFDVYDNETGFGVLHTPGDAESDATVHGISFKTLTSIHLDMRVDSNICRSYLLQWNSKKNGYLAINYGKNSCNKNID